MAEKLSQSVRIAAEAAQAPPAELHRSRAPAIVARYRLQPEDLPTGRHAGRIHSINTQGVEALTSLAFIEGLAKPIALDDAAVQMLVRMTDSPFAGDWIGCMVEVRAVRSDGVRSDGVRSVRLYAPGAAALPVDAPARPHPGRWRAWLTAFAFLLLVVAAVALVLWVEQGAALWASLEQIMQSLTR